ncbi:MAG: M18 family aminopeptidase [Butyrivibrio sp.]|uniref:M18 family aminopeptidase n=1 Tax=Butyrivibrio sp. TaxID=28121 RepID=UPI0025D7B04E|nr:M18 family aminopeptidase [Butyrivibrio sp.]MCR5773392.1 M18 family aminopeptidase [Butyrivibrio sp.]
MFEKITKDMLKFIDASPTCYHVINNMEKRLEAEGYTRLRESEDWKIKAGGKYFVNRNGSSIISFQIPKKDFKGFLMTASHSDSPSFKIKENPEMPEGGMYVKLNVEGYGGMLDGPWFDRPLSIAGRVFVKDDDNNISMKLVNIDRDLVMMPSLAIHMNREANSGYKFNAQKDMQPIFGDIASKGTYNKTVAKAAGVKESDVIGSDLFLYNRVKPTVWGAGKEYISSSRLDDQECVYTTFEAFLNSASSSHVLMHCVFDNEEVGSGTKQGAASTFLKDTLERICDGCGRTRQQYHTALAQSFMLSADNAHAMHPNHGDKADPVNRPCMNKGIVIKFNANQKYTTDGASEAMLRMVLDRAKVPYQMFTNRSDMPGGSTLGNISNTQVALNTVDIGLAQLAMHSPYETAGSKDPKYMAEGVKAFYESNIDIHIS